MRAEKAADGWTDHKTQAERRADHAKLFGAFFRRGNVGDVGEGRGDVGGSDAGKDAADKEPAQRRGEGHENVIEAEAEAGNQDHGTAAEAVRPGPENRRKNKLHGGPGETEVAGDNRGAGDVAAFEMNNEIG
jgi:hypothetical protein